MRNQRMITVCGWCPTELPNDDWEEVAHHFLVCHNVTGSQSLRYFYPDDIDAEFERWESRVAATPKEDQ